MAQLISGYEDLVYGEDGHAPIRKVLEDALTRAQEDKVRLSIEVRVQPVGVPNTRQEAKFFADPHETTSDNLMRILVDRMEDSPGPEFHGQIRINFAPAGHSGEKYGSWTRTIRYSAGNLANPAGMRSVTIEGDEDDNNAELLHLLEAAQSQGMNGAGPVDNAQMRQWLETAMGFTFRSMAQQMTMFERATRMLEAYVLRFNFPGGNMPGGVTEVPTSSGAPNNGAGGLGLLPMLLNAASHLANADTPADMAGRAGSMATGAPPPTGAARQAAIQGAGRLIGTLGNPSPPADPADGFEPPPPLPHPHDPTPDHGNGGGGAFFEDDDYDSFSDLAQDPAEALSELSPQDMKEAVVQWIRANPDQNKQAVMDMLPELSKEIM